MYLFLCLLSGVLLAMVITLNGSLTEYYGPWLATVVVHIVGTLGAYLVMKAMRQPHRPTEKIPLWMYSGGAIGILTTIFQSVAFARLGVTAILALSLFGQTVTSVVIDSFGIGGMEKRRVNKATVLGVLVSMCGIGYLLLGAGNLQVYALLMSVASGVSGVLSRIANAQLAAHTSAAGSSFTNHWVGLVGSVVLLLVLQPDFVSVLRVVEVPLWVYCGGACGVVMVMLWNIAGLKVSAFRLTLLSFIGQVFAGIALDLLLGNGFSKQTFIGGSFVLAGMILNMLAERSEGKTQAFG